MKTKSLIRKRTINASILLVTILAALLVFRLCDIALHPTATYSGLLLLALLVLLALLSVRKRIRFLPIGSAEIWLQLHIYMGLFTGVLFGIHIHWRMPTGVFDWALALAYMTVFLSGIAGTIMSRVLPKRLTTRGDEVLFQHIPRRRTEIQKDVERIVMSCMERTDSSAVPQFYIDRLKPFFDRPRHQFQHLLQSNRPRMALLAEIKGFERYVNESERESIAEIVENVRIKDNLDYQLSLQSALKYWLFIHVPMTYVLLLLATIHMILMFAYSGGIG